ncbi:hypothetical protein [Phenylobacterium sp.]|jgi:ACT domain-containing protein|uniref:hypothetical protein n=1 Tax=Phenylobacterium sp. TaxID=1871053 RepID=UPI002F3E8375
MSDADPVRPRRTFLVTAADAPDTLLRVLNPFVVAGAAFAAVSLERAPRGGVEIRIEVEGLDADRAASLRERIAGLVCVRSVGVLQLNAGRQAA